MRVIREKLYISRSDFAEQYGFSKGTLEKWEQGSRHPEGAAQAFLTVIAKEPELLFQYQFYLNQDFLCGFSCSNLHISGTSES